EHFLPRLGAQAPQRAVVRHAGVVDQVVHSSQTFSHGGDELLDLGVVAHVAAGAVHRHAQGADRGLGEQRLGGDVAVGEVDVVDRHRHTALRELERGGAAQARRPARDHDHAPVDRRGESVNAAWRLIAALCSYAVGYRFYSRFLATRVFGLDDRRATPAERHNNGRDFVPTNTWVLYGHHFAAIAGAGPLVGPVLAAQFGFLPGTLWLVIGVVLGGAVQDFTILFCSLRRDGKSLGQMAKEEVNPAAGATAMLAVLFI